MLITKENIMNVSAIGKNLPDVVLDTCLVPVKKAAVDNVDDFFPATALITEDAAKLAEKAKKEEEAKNIAALVGNIINYFG